MIRDIMQWRRAVVRCGQRFSGWLCLGLDCRAGSTRRRSEEEEEGDVQRRQGVVAARSGSNEAMDESKLR
jgi:hypothetical protein